LPRLVFKHPRLLSDEASLQILLNQFRAAHPEVQLHEEILPSSSDQQHLFYVTNLEAGSSDFDVFALDVIWIPEFARAGWLPDLTPRLGTAGLTDFIAGPVAAATQNGRVYAIPWFLDAGVLYYRRDLLEKHKLSPPQTWEQLRTTAQTVLHGEADPRLTGFVWQGKQYEGLVCTALEFIRAYGGEVFGPGGTIQLAQPQSMAGLQALRHLITDGISPAVVTTADEETTRHIFHRGEAIFMRNWPYAWTLLNAEDSPVRGKVGVAAIPGSETHESSPTLGGWHLGINRFTTQPDLAWQLIAFLTSPEAQRQLAVTSGLKPTRVSVYANPQVQQADPSLSTFFPFLQQAQPRPVSPFYLMASQVLQSEISAIITGLKPVELAVKDAEQQLRRILAIDSTEGKGVTTREQ
jgi:multiple sugar transport system substrate-binding protein